MNLCFKKLHRSLSNGPQTWVSRSYLLKLKQCTSVEFVIVNSRCLFCWNQKISPLGMHRALIKSKCNYGFSAFASITPIAFKRLNSVYHAALHLALDKQSPLRVWRASRWPLLFIYPLQIPHLLGHNSWLAWFRNVSPQLLFIQIHPFTRLQTYFI